MNTYGIVRRDGVLLWAGRAESLRDAALSGADLSDADLVGADLSGANLSSTDLSGAYLGYAPGATT